VKVKSLFFSRIREALGKSEAVLEVAPGISVRELATDLLNKNGLQELRDLPLLYAVNESYVTPETTLQDGDEVALIPPVAGG